MSAIDSLPASVVSRHPARGATPVASRRQPATVPTDVADANAIAAQLDGGHTAEREAGPPTSDLEACRSLLDELSRSPDVERLLTPAQSAALKLKVRRMLLEQQAERAARQWPGSPTAAPADQAPSETSPRGPAATSWSLDAMGGVAAAAILAVCCLLTAL